MLKHPNIDVSRLGATTTVELVLWNVPDYLGDYVKLLYNRVRAVVIDEVKDGVARYSLSMHDLTSVIKSNYEGVGTKET